MTKTIKVLKDFTYYALIKEAIYSTKDMQATASEIFDYFVLRFPELFTPLNSMTWKGNIRQVLSKNPEFIKRSKSGNSKQHYWSHRPIEVLMAEKCKKIMNSENINTYSENSINKVILVDKYPNYLRQKRQIEQENLKKLKISENLVNRSRGKYDFDDKKIIHKYSFDNSTGFCNDIDYDKLFKYKE